MRGMLVMRGRGCVVSGGVGEEKMCTLLMRGCVSDERGRGCMVSGWVQGEEILMIGRVGDETDT